MCTHNQGWETRINPDFRIENSISSMNFHFYTCSQDHPFLSKVVIWVNICLKKLIITLIISCIAPDKRAYPHNFLISQ